MYNKKKCEKINAYKIVNNLLLKIKNNIFKKLTLLLSYDK